MSRKVIVPDALRIAAETANMSPGILAGDFVFLTGSTGGDAHGHMPQAPAAQIENAFGKIADVLAVADLTLDAVVEMTTYHIGLRDHFDIFDAIRTRIFAPPYPAWTAVEVAGLRRPQAIVEIRVIAQITR